MERTEIFTQLPSKITHVVRQFHPAIGGLEDFAFNLACEQVNQGHHVRVVTLNRIFSEQRRLEPHEWLNGIEVVRIPYFGSNRYPVAPAVLGHLADADIVHVHAVDFFLDFLALTKFLHRKPLFLSTHGGFFHTAFAQTLKKLFFRTVTRLSLKACDAIFASSVQDKETFDTILPERRKAIAIPNGVNVTKFLGTANGSHHRHIIYFGRLSTNKRLDLLFPLMKELVRLDPDWRLTIAGRRQEFTAETLSTMARDYGIEPNIKIVESPSSDALRDLIRSATIFVNPSRYEGFGIAAIEAFSAGLVPVLSDIPAHRETVARLRQGKIVNFADHHTVARLISDNWTEWTQERDAYFPQLEQLLKPYAWSTVADLVNRQYGTFGKRRILQTHVSVISRESAADAIYRAAANATPLKVAFVNANLALAAHKNEALSEQLRAFLLLNDGIGLDIASLWLYGASFPANLNGTDFTPYLLDHAPTPLRLYLLGADEAVLRKAAMRFTERWRRHHIVGSHNGFFSADDEDRLANEIRQSCADIVLVAMGNPRQEQWISRHIPSAAPVGIGVGALFDFQTGAVKRAPLWVRKLRFEWVFRLLQEPSRLLERYTKGNLEFLMAVLRQRR